MCVNAVSSDQPPRFAKVSASTKIVSARAITAESRQAIQTILKVRIGLPFDGLANAIDRASAPIIAMEGHTSYELRLSQAGSRVRERCELWLRCPRRPHW